MTLAPKRVSHLLLFMSPFSKGGSDVVIVTLHGNHAHFTFLFIIVT